MVEGVADSQQITATGGAAPYSFTVTSGKLPPGLSLSTSGVISGTPAIRGRYPVRITATDASAPADSGSQFYFVDIQD